jgi:hypothetical protein
MRASICKDASFLDSLSKALQSRDEPLQASALALLADLSDSQEAVRLLRESIVVRVAFRVAHAVVTARAKEDPEAYREEAACAEAVEAAVGLLGAA